MPVDLILKNCKVVKPNGIFSTGVAVDDGKIVAVAHDSLLPAADRTIDCHGNHVLPGVFDNHVHIGVYKPWIPDLNETASALAGGVTSVGNYIGMGYIAWTGSYSSKMSEWISDYNKNAFVDGFFHFPLQSDIQIDEVEKYYRDYKANFFKFLPYLGGEANGLGLQEVDDGQIYDGFRRASRLGPPVTIATHCENTKIIRRLKNQLMAAGRQDAPANTESRPQPVETLDVLKVLYMAKVFKTPLYIVHVTSSDSVDAIARAKANGQKVTAESCTHHLTMDKNNSLGALGIEYPALKDREDIDRLWRGLADGTIDTIATDHCSTTRDQKTNIWTVKAGFPGWETLLPLVLSEGVKKRGLPLTRAVQVLSENPARVNEVYPRKGAIEVGSDADLVVVDLKRTVKISMDKLHYKLSDYCIWDGWSIDGWPVTTILRGNVVVEDGAINAKPGAGKYTERDIIPK